MLKEFFMSVSAISVILAGIWFVIPDGNMKKPIKYSLGVFTIAALISAVSKITFTFPEITTENTMAQVSHSIEISSIETAIETVLTKNNISVEKVTAVTDISEKERINITKVKLKLDNVEDIERATEIVMNETGITAECE